MSLSIKTDGQPEQRGLTCSQTEALYFLFYRSDQYHYHFHFAYRDTTGEKERFCGYAGTLFTGDEADESFDGDFPEGVDIYVTPNGFSNAYHRQGKYLRGLQNIVVDIDAHGADLSPGALHDHIADFEGRLLERLSPQPNFAHQTGRGLQLWYCFEVCSIKLKPIVMGTVNGIISQIRHIMRELGEDILSIDESASKKLEGLFRLPYTYNTKYHGWSNGKLLHEDVRNINELFAEIHDSGWDCGDFSRNGNFGQPIPYVPKWADRKSRKPRMKQGCAIRRGDYTPCFFHRKKFLEHLLKTRNMHDGGGNREILLFAMYHVMTNLLDSTYAAQEYILELNASLPDPLSEYEIKGCIFQQIDKYHYRFPNENFLKIVNATDAEREYFRSLSKRKTVQQERRNKKEMRDTRIRDLYASGMAITAIAKEIGCSRPTIYSVLRECKV